MIKFLFKEYKIGVKKMVKQTDIRGDKTGILKRLISEKRGHGDPYIRGDVRDKESFVNVGEAAFNGQEATLTIFTDIVNPKVVIAAPSGAYAANDQLSWTLNSKGRTISGSYIDIIRNTSGTSGLPVSVLIVGVDKK